MDVVSRIQAFKTGRDPERLKLKYGKMRKNTFAFLRGTSHLFYGRLPAGALFQSARLAWVCGDLHSENFGVYKADNGEANFDINDFDESVLAPLSWDLLRMLCSLWVGAESASIPRSDTRNLCEVFLDAYAASLSLGKSYWIECETAQGSIHGLLEELRGQKPAKFLDANTKLIGKKRILRLNAKKALPVSHAQRAEVMNAMDKFAQAQADSKFFEVLDVARHVAGTGSLGVGRYVVLVRGRISQQKRIARSKAICDSFGNAAPDFSTTFLADAGAAHRIYSASTPSRYAGFPSADRHRQQSFCAALPAIQRRQNRPERLQPNSGGAKQPRRYDW